jgi:copper chaperone CopZ
MKNWTFCVFMQHLVLRVPLCCEKCIDKVKKALYEVEGVRNVECDQAEQKVIVSGNVDPERAVRRVRRVKKKSLYWNMETKPLRSF